MKIKKISAALFERAIEGTGFAQNEKGKFIARAVLVDGQSQSAVAKGQGVSRQYIHKIVSEVVRAYDELATQPSMIYPDGVVKARAADPRMGIVSVELELPRILADKMDALAKLMRKTRSRGRIERCVNAVLEGLKDGEAELEK